MPCLPTVITVDGKCVRLDRAWKGETETFVVYVEDIGWNYESPAVHLNAMPWSNSESCPVANALSYHALCQVCSLTPTQAIISAGDITEASSVLARTYLVVLCGLLQDTDEKQKQSLSVLLENRTRVHGAVLQETCGV